MQTVEQDFAEIGGEEEEADEVRPNVYRLVVHPEPAVECGSELVNMGFR